MSPASGIVARLRARGAVLTCLPGGRLAVDGPPEVLTDADRAELRAHKADVLELLAREAGRQELAPRVARIWSERLADWIISCFSSGDTMTAGAAMPSW